MCIESIALKNEIRLLLHENHIMCILYWPPVCYHNVPIEYIKVVCLTEIAQIKIGAVCACDIFHADHFKYKYFLVAIFAP